MTTLRHGNDSFSGVERYSEAELQRLQQTVQNRQAQGFEILGAIQEIRADRMGQLALGLTDKLESE